MKKILIVDDDPGIVESLSAILEDEGYSVETALQGEEALRLVPKKHPDLVILDVLISGTDGRDICRSLKSDQETQNIPVVMISAHPQIRDEVFAAGANEFVAKPFEIDDLLHVIDKLVA